MCENSKSLSIIQWQVSHNGHNTWKLHIREVQRNDSGHYMCQVAAFLFCEYRSLKINFVKICCKRFYSFSNNDQINTEPMVSQIGMLSVVEAPDILYNQVKREDNEKSDNIYIIPVEKRIMMSFVDKSEDGEKSENSDTISDKQ